MLSIIKMPSRQSYNEEGHGKSNIKKKIWKSDSCKVDAGWDDVK